jgi:predicted enzyme related to lactoylglutathione lyase
VPCIEPPNTTFGARIARYADPDGTQISVGEERPASPVVHWQILSRDPERAAGFYREVLGWRVAATDALGQRAVDTGSARGISGGIWPCPPEGHGFAQLFVAVSDVEATVRAVQAHGGRVIIPPQRLPDGSQVAIVADAEGIPFGITRFG